MEPLGRYLMIVGTVGLLASWYWSLRLAFRESVGLGIVSIFVPILLIYFLMTNFNRTWKPTLIGMASFALLIYGVTLTNPPR